MRWTAALLVLVAGPAALADRGSIPFEPDVRIFEPHQRALIAWSGEEEILLLSTDLSASRPTKVLEVIPLPSEPEVKKGDVEAFRRANELIRRKLRGRLRAEGAGFRGDAPRAGPAGEVTFHERIGAHDITVTRVRRADGFLEWVQAYLRSQGAETPTVPEPLQRVVAEYIRDEFTWFVFDVVELGPETRTNDAIQYRFLSDRLFYPLRITRTEEGDTTIRLLILSPELFSRFPGLEPTRIRLLHEPVTLTAEELGEVNEDMAALLGRQDGVKLRVWEIRGRLSAFEADLMAR